MCFGSTGLRNAFRVEVSDGGSGPVYGRDGVPLEVKAEIGERLGRGEKWREVAAAVGVSEKTISRIVIEAGGMSPRWKDRNPRQLSLAERKEISRGLERGESLRVIGAAFGRQPWTIGREVNVNGGRVGYRAWRADRRACGLARRAKPTLFGQNRQ